MKHAVKSAEIKDFLTIAERLFVMGFMKTNVVFKSILALIFAAGVFTVQAEETPVTEETTSTESTQPEKAADPVAQQPPQNMFPDGLILPGTGATYSEYTFVADKERRTLTVWRFKGSQVEFVEAHPIDYGKIKGDKLVSGDKKTPEGIYFFQKRLSGNELNFDEYGQMALTMDYPNFFDKRERKTGHGIWLHAIPDSKTLYRGSRGCLVVRNQIIPLLSKYVTLQKTPILVYEKVNYVSAQDLKNKQAAIKETLESWRTSWSAKDLDSYISHYSENFKSLGMNKARWKSYKEKLNEKYESIQVELNNVVVFNHNNEIIVKFLQAYKSDTLSDFGEKSLYMSRNPESGKFQIVGEEWRAVEQSLIASTKEKEETPSN